VLGLAATLGGGRTGDRVSSHRALVPLRLREKIEMGLGTAAQQHDSGERARRRLVNERLIMSTWLVVTGLYEKRVECPDPQFFRP
jgi:hypothetical protein